MKRIIACLLLLSLTLFALPCRAVEAQENWVYDYAGLLTGDEIASLNEEIRQLRLQLEMDMVILTTYGTGNSSIQQFSDDFYDNQGFGYGSTDSGILLVLDMEAREWYMSTCGEALYIFTDYGLDQLGEVILPGLSGGDYFGAFSLWLEALPGYVHAYQNGKPLDGYVTADPNRDEILYYEDSSQLGNFPLALFIGLVAAVVVILVLRGQMNTAKFQPNAAEYLKQGSFRLRQRSDMFLYSRVTKTLRPKNNTSGGGGSSVHRSSGGVRHGGRGGRF